jgi:uncharacterized protein YycO
MITVRWVAHPGPFTWAVRLAQYGYWPSHCEAVLPDGTRLGSWFLKGGVRIRPADYDAGSFSREMFIRIKATTAQEIAFYSFLRAEVGKPYDWRAIISFYSKMSGRDWQADDSWECSELIGSAFAACGILPKHMAVKFSRITPRDLVLLISTLTEAGENA